MPIDLPPRGQQRLRLGRHSVPGCCYHVTFRVEDPHGPLNSEAVRQLVAEAIQGMLGRGFRCLEAYVVMPDHVHILFVLDSRRSLSATIGALKTFTAFRINRLTGRTGTFWNPGFHDHLIRCETDFARHFDYILENPVRAGLVQNINDYPFCRWGLGESHKPGK